MTKTQKAMQIGGDLFSAALLGLLAGAAAVAAAEEEGRKQAEMQKRITRKREMIYRNWQHCQIGREFDTR